MSARFIRMKVENFCLLKPVMAAKTKDTKVDGKMFFPEQRGVQQNNKEACGQRLLQEKILLDTQEIQKLHG